MGKKIKLKNDVYLGTESIVHGKTMLKEILDKKFVEGYAKDLNNISETGVVYANTRATNKPNENGYCITLAVSTNYRKQIYYVQNKLNYSYVRTYNEGAWTEWLKTN